jgi:toxin YoeB
MPRWSGLGVGEAHLFRLATFAPNTVLTSARGSDPHREKAPAASPKRLALLHDEFREDLSYWIAENPRIALRLMKLMEECLRTPFTGTGKPEPLKHLSAWSRRLTDEDRLVYAVTDTEIHFVQARFHYHR